MGYKGGVYHVSFFCSIREIRYEDTGGGGLPIELQRGIIDERESLSERKKEQQGYSLVVKWPDGGGQVYSGDRDRDRDRIQS